MTDDRLTDLKNFYEILAGIERKNGGARLLSDCTGRMRWPLRGVYFFQEPGEVRNDTGGGLRIVRVGTHATRHGARTKLWGRLAQHRGNAKNGGGNHRASIFRLLVGAAMINKEGTQHPTWGHGNSAPLDVRNSERPMERTVSSVIGAMTVIWLDIQDEPGPSSLRGHIEENAIALLSNFDRAPLDSPSPSWLGHYSNRELVGRSGLWNSDYVQQAYDSSFLDKMAALADR